MVRLKHVSCLRGAAIGEATAAAAVGGVVVIHGVFVGDDVEDGVPRSTEVADSEVEDEGEQRNYQEKDEEDAVVGFHGGGSWWLWMLVERCKARFV